MKKRILALACAMTLVFGMSLTVSAAGSSSADKAASTAVQNTQGEVVSTTNSTGQVLTGATLAEFAETTGISGVAGAKLGVVSNETAKSMIAEANKVVGSGAFIATIVDLQVPAGTGTATFTLSCPNVWKGQSVKILHLKSDGTYEVITPSSVANNAVTFTMSSYSPIALVIDTTAPKTADAGLATGLMIAVLAMAGAVASAVYSRKVTK